LSHTIQYKRFLPDTAAGLQTRSLLLLSFEILICKNETWIYISPFVPVVNIHFT